MFFPMDFKRIFLILFILILPILSISIQQKTAPWYFSPIRSITSYIQSGYSFFSINVKETIGLYLNLIDIKKDNRQLKLELDELKTQLLIQKEIEIENERLKTLLDFQQKNHMNLLPARVIGYDLSGQHSTIRINKGEQHRVKKGQAIISPEGVVGTIFSVQSHTSQILMVTDHYSVIDAIIQNSRARGVVEGRAGTHAHIKYLQRTDEVHVGDLVVTSGLDNIFPKGYPIGVISKVEKKTYGISQYVEVQSYVKPHQIEDVFIVLNPNNPKKQAFFENYQFQSSSYDRTYRKETHL